MRADVPLNDRSTLERCLAPDHERIGERLSLPRGGAGVEEELQSGLMDRGER